VQLYLRRRAGAAPWRSDSLAENEAEGTQADMTHVPKLATSPQPTEPRPMPPPESARTPRPSALSAPAAEHRGMSAAREGLGALESLAYGASPEAPVKKLEL